MRPGDLDTGEPIVTADEVAERAGIAPRTLHAYVVRGHAPKPDGYLSRTPVWRESTVAEWLEQRAAAPPPDPNDHLKLPDAADLAGITYRELVDLLEDGTLKPVNQDGVVRVRRGDLEALRR